MNRNAEMGGCVQLRGHLLMTRGSLASLLVVLPLHCSLTQKCQAMSPHLAAVVYHALWSRLIRDCDTSQLFLFCLVGILNNKATLLQSTRCFWFLHFIFFFQWENHLCLSAKQVYLKQARLEEFPIWGSFSTCCYVRSMGLIFIFYCRLITNQLFPFAFLMSRYLTLSSLDFNSQTVGMSNTFILPSWAGFPDFKPQYEYLSTNKRLGRK